MILRVLGLLTILKNHHDHDDDDDLIEDGPLSPIICLLIERWQQASALGAESFVPDDFQSGPW